MHRNGRGSNVHGVGIFTVAMVISPIAGTWMYNRLGSEVLWLRAHFAGLLVWIGFQGFGRLGKTVSSPAQYHVQDKSHRLNTNSTV